MKTSKKKIELLSPAGDFECLTAAINDKNNTKKILIKNIITSFFSSFFIIIIEIKSI